MKSIRIAPPWETPSSRNRQTSQDHLPIQTREVYDDPERGYLRRPVGCGPFRFDSWVSGRYIKLEKFPDYYGIGPFVDQLVFYIIDSQETALAEYRAGNLDLTDEIPSGKRKALQEEFGDQYRRWPQIQVRAFAFNHARPPFQGNRAPAPGGEPCGGP